MNDQEINESVEIKSNWKPKKVYQIAYEKTMKSNEKPNEIAFCNDFLQWFCYHGAIIANWVNEIAWIFGGNAINHVKASIISLLI